MTPAGTGRLALEADFQEPSCVSVLSDGCYAAAARA